MAGTGALTTVDVHQLRCLTSCSTPDGCGECLGIVLEPYLNERHLVNQDGEMRIELIHGFSRFNLVEVVQKLLLSSNGSGPLEVLLSLVVITLGIGEPFMYFF